MQGGEWDDEAEERNRRLLQRDRLIYGVAYTDVLGTRIDPVEMGREPQCSPLCGASKAYGRFDAPWKHEPECPVRLASEAD